MPYIKEVDRAKFQQLIQQATEAFTSDKNLRVGELNYVISSLVWDIFEAYPSYSMGNNLMGVLESVKQEFYRRKLAPYEDEKIKENGDI